MKKNNQSRNSIIAAPVAGGGVYDSCGIDRDADAGNVSASPAAPPDFGALVISLDLELYWGVTDIFSRPGPHDANISAVGFVVHSLLDLFEERRIAATWCIVGRLFADSASDAEQYYPARCDLDRRLPCHRQDSGPGSERFYYGPGLVAAIAGHASQEIGTHTFSHYYCLEPGHKVEKFEEDLAAAIAIARRDHIQITSIAFPRNQINESYLGLLPKYGISAYRGAAAGWMYKPGTRREQRNWGRRAARLVDAYIRMVRDTTVGWDDIQQHNGVCNVRASRYLRPYSPLPRHLEKQRIRRIVGEIETAARTHRLFHLWWHPEDIGPNCEPQMENLRAILDAFDRCRARYGMQSLAMRDVVAVLAR